MRKNYLLLLAGLGLVIFTAIAVNFGIRTFKTDTKFNPAIPMAPLVLVIDPGHGGIDSGATVTRDRIFEKDLNLALALKLKKVLEQNGARVILTRNRDESLSHLNRQERNRHRRDLAARVSIINNTRPHFFISLHANYSQRRSGEKGPIVFYHPTSPESKELAYAVQRQLNGITGYTGFNRNAYQGDFYLLRNTNYRGILVETGFLSNPEERNRLLSPVYQEQIALAIARGILEHRLLLTARQKASRANNQKLPVAGQKIFRAPHEVVLYFAPQDSRSELLIPVRRLLTVKVKDPRRLALWALQQVLAGPQGNEQQKYLPIVDPHVRIKHLVIRNGNVELTLNRSLACGEGSYDEYLATEALSKTLGSLSLGLNNIRILVAEPETGTTGSHLDLSAVMPVLAPPRGRVAIIIDDLGQGARGTKEIMEINRPLTLAIIPFQPYSRQEATIAHRRGYEVIVHLPMEPLHPERYRMPPQTIRTSLSDPEITKLTEKAINEVPYLAGLNNHMGSKATSDVRVVKDVLQVVHRHHLYAIDSYTIPTSVMLKVAREIGVPAARRQVFLDNSSSVAAIKKQLQHLADLALAQGSSIAIGHVGHPGLATATAIQEMIPELESQGIELVYASAMIKPAMPQIEQPRPEKPRINQDRK